MYILYNTTAQGYLTKSSTYSSAWHDAKHFERDEAIAIARKHKTHAGQGMILIALADMEALI